MDESGNKLATERLSILDLAESLGSVSEACRRRGVTRDEFNEYQRRFQQHGLAGLKDLPSDGRPALQDIPPETAERVAEMALAHPGDGWNRLEARLREGGYDVSCVTIQKVLNKRGLGTRHQRWKALERREAETPGRFSAEQIAFIERNNPCFCERRFASARPGELLAQHTFYVGQLDGVGKVYLHTVVDTHGSYAFGTLNQAKQSDGAVAVLREDVLPFYMDMGLPIGAIITDNGREFRGRHDHLYGRFLAVNEIEHRTTSIGRSQTNGFVERFHGIALDEFFRSSLRSRDYESIDVLQQDFGTWLAHYNTERPHVGYRNHGRTPWSTVQKYVDRVTMGSA